MPVPATPTSKEDEPLRPPVKEGGELAVSGAREGIEEVLIVDQLSGAERQGLKTSFRDFFEGVYTGERKEDLEIMHEITVGDAIMDNIAEQVNEPEYLEHRISNPRFSEACALFLDEMTNLIQQKSKLPDGQKKVDGFIDYFDAVLFNTSSIGSTLRPTALFGFLAKASRTLRLKDRLPINMLIEFTYKMRYQGVTKEIITEIEKSSTIRQLDAINFLEVIGLQAMRTDEWSKGEAETTKRILRAIEESNLSTFIHHAATTSSQVIEDEQNERNFRHYAGRLIEIFSIEDQKIGSELKNKVEIDEDIPPNSMMLPISSDYIAVFDRFGLIELLAPCNATELSPDSKRKVDFQPCEAVVKGFEFNPFQTIDSEDIPLLLQQLHRPRMKEKIEENLGVSLREMSLATQVQLLRFMAEEKLETFEKLRGVLPGQGEARQHFLTAFLACAKDQSYGHKILELAKSYPSQSGLIFERFYQIISVTHQEETRLQTALMDNPNLKDKTNLEFLYRTMLERGAELLTEAYYKINQIEDIEAYLQEAKRYQLKLIAFRGIFDAITAGDTPISPGEIEQLTADKIKAEIVKGGDLLAFDPKDFSEDELKNKMLDESSYPNPSQFNKADYLMVLNNIRKTYKKSDEKWADYLIRRIPYNLMNANADFILIRNEEAQLVGIGRSEKKGENHFYMGTFYVEDGYQGIGRYIGEYLKTGLPENAEIEGATAPANPATSWHIEMNDYVGSQIIREGESGPLIECSNCPGEQFKTKNKQDFSQDKIVSMGTGDFEEGTIKIIQTDTTPEKAGENIDQLSPLISEGYKITRFFYQDPKAEAPAANTWIVLEKVA